MDSLMEGPLTDRGRDPGGARGHMLPAARVRPVAPTPPGRWPHKSRGQPGDISGRGELERRQRWYRPACRTRFSHLETG